MNLNNLQPTQATAAGPVAGFDPILISLVRRSLPNLIAYDVCGVQPMTGPTGLIFAMRARYTGQGSSNPEAFYNEANTIFSGNTSQYAPYNNYGFQGNSTTDTSNNAINKHKRIITLPVLLIQPTLAHEPLNGLFYNLLLYQKTLKKYY